MSELDPEIRAMAEENRLRWPAPYAEPSIARARASYTERYRTRSLPPTSQIIVERLAIPGPAGPIAARSYAPAGSIAASLPTLVYFHGGGFVLGEADGYELQSMRLAELAHCLVVFPEFRLAPEHPFPAAVHDAVAVVRWCAQNATATGAVSPLAVAGDSAGGNLALNACIAARNSGFPSIAFQCLLYPHADFRPFYGGLDYPSIAAFGSGFLLDRVLLEWFANHYLPGPEAAQDPRASPILEADLAGLPRTAIVTAECDPLRDMGAALARRLREADVAVDYRCVGGLAHNFMGHVRASSRARKAFEEVAALIRTALA